MRVWRLSVCRVHRAKSRTERPRKTKISTEIAHVTCDLDTIFKVKRSRSTCRGHIVAASRTAFCYVCRNSVNKKTWRKLSIHLTTVCTMSGLGIKSYWVKFEKNSQASLKAKGENWVIGFVRLSVGRITQNIVDELWIIFLDGWDVWLATDELDFGGDPDYDVDAGIFKGIFTLLRPR